MIDREYTEKLLARLPELETELSEPETARNPRKFRELVREHARLKKIRDKADAYFELVDDISEHRELQSADGDEELRALARDELSGLEEKLPAVEKDLMVSLLPPDPDHERNAVMEVRAGTGGDEAALFAGDLFRMYSRYVEHQGWTIRLVDISTSEVGGYKEAVFTVEGDNVYGRLQYESGTHRVQRVPATESQGRIHTSAATVAVFPEADEDDEIDLPAEDVRVDIYRSSGPGGQSVNTTDSAVRVTHVPTGIVVQCQDEKSQHRNKERAMSVLKARILDQRRREEAQRRGDVRRSQIGSGDRSERVRTYNFPQNRLTDHRINMTLYSLDRVMEGALDELLDALRQHDVELRLASELKAADG